MSLKKNPNTSRIKSLKTKWGKFVTTTSLLSTLLLLPNFSNGQTKSATNTQTKSTTVATENYKDFYDRPIDTLIKEKGIAKATEIIQQNILSEINNIRTGLGIGALQLDSSLIQASQDYAKEMFDKNHFGHIGPDGSTPDQRAKKAGGGGYVGENLGADFGSIKELIELWLKSEDHSNNIIDHNWGKIGIGYCPGYAVTMFSK